MDHSISRKMIANSLLRWIFFVFAFFFAWFSSFFARMCLHFCPIRIMNEYKCAVSFTFFSFRLVFILSSVQLHQVVELRVICLLFREVALCLSPSPTGCLRNYETFHKYCISQILLPNNSRFWLFINCIKFQFNRTHLFCYSLYLIRFNLIFVSLHAIRLVSTVCLSFCK